MFEYYHTRTHDVVVYIVPGTNIRFWWFIPSTIREDEDI